MGKKYSTGHLSISFEGLVEHIKNKTQCQKHTSEKIICVSVQWPLERSPMEMSDLIYSSASWPWKNFHFVINVTRQRHELHKTFFFSFFFFMVHNLCLWHNVRGITFMFLFFKGNRGQLLPDPHIPRYQSLRKPNDINVTNCEHELHLKWSQAFRSP